VIAKLLEDIDGFERLRLGTSQQRFDLGRGNE
jgi:hypothetical protein